MTGRLSLDQDRDLPMPRCYWLNDGETLDVGDRTLLAIRPPVFDAPTTRGLFDPTTGVYWASDALAQFTSEPGESAAEAVHRDGWESFYYTNRLVAPWHQYLDDGRYNRMVDGIEKLGVEVIAACHTPTWSGAAVGEALRRIRELPSLPPVHEAGQADLTAMLAGAMEPAEPLPVA